MYLTQFFPKGGGAGAFAPYALFQETFTGTRTYVQGDNIVLLNFSQINTSVANEISLNTGTGVITLVEGTYQVYAKADTHDISGLGWNSYNTSYQQLELRQISPASQVLIGTAASIARDNSGIVFRDQFEMFGRVKVPAGGKTYQLYYKNPTNGAQVTYSYQSPTTSIEILKL